MPSSSRIVTRTDDGLPAVTSDGSVPSATVNVSSSSSASSAVVTTPVPVVCPPATVMLSSAPGSPDSAVPAVSASEIVTLPDSVSDSRAVTVTDCPSSTGFGATDRLTIGGVEARRPQRRGSTAWRSTVNSRGSPSWLRRSCGAAPRASQSSTASS